MIVNEIPIETVIPYIRNPRKNEGAVAKVAASIKEFGFKQPIVVDKDHVIVVGHTRLMAAQRLNMAQVPIVMADDLTDAQIKAYRIADNRVSQESDWDFELLKLELDDLVGLDFELLETGFDQLELDNLLNEDKEGLTDPDEIPDAPEPVAKLGDVWLLGPHRLVCGDATNADDVGLALNGVKPHLMVTDPPYGVEYDANWRSETKRADGTAIGAFAVAKVSNDDRADWREAWALFPGDVAYVWHADKKGHIAAASLESCELNIRAQIIWSKNNMVIGRGDYHSKHEPCWYAVRKGRKGHYCGGRKQTTVWEINKPTKSETGHSTQKPVECMKRPIENNSSPGQAIYEPFCGSGTTIIAGEITGRVIHAIEINPQYVDIAVKRWENFTGETAELLKAEAA